MKGATAILEIVAIVTMLDCATLQLNAQTQRASEVTISVSTSSGEPLQSAMVFLQYQGVTILRGLTDMTGTVHFRDVAYGRYRLTVKLVGYASIQDSLLIFHPVVLDSLRLHPRTAGEIVVSDQAGPAITSVDAAGNQVLESESDHPPPSARITQIIQQNLMGAVRAPTGEVHIRGQHGEYTYYVDGAPVPLGVFGGLNEIVDPQVIQRATFLSGGWPAEYGGQMAAIIDILTHVPSGSLQASATSYVGSYVPDQQKSSVIDPNRAINSDGQSLTFSDHTGPFGWFLSGSRNETDRRIDAPAAMIFHDHGSDLFYFGKADYLLSDREYLTLDASIGKTTAQVPYDPIETGPQDDIEQISEAFQTLSYFRTLSNQPEQESNLQESLFLREGGLTFQPGAIDSASFHFASDSTHGYVITEDQQFVTIGDRLRIEKRWNHKWLTVAGGSLSLTHGSQDFLSRDSSDQPGPGTQSNYVGSEFGLFAQTEWQINLLFRLDAGVRYDQQISPDIEFQNQVSPRLRLNFFFDDMTSAYLYYGRLFMPTVIESIHPFTSAVSATGVPTVAERDDFYEAVLVHRIESGVSIKFDYYLKNSSPGVDDETVGNSAVKIPFNLQFVRSQGIEAGVAYNPEQSPFSGYINSSLSHVFSWGLQTGGFLPIQTTNGPVDRDHDQRLSAVMSINYQPSNWFANILAIYGSGLSNANLNIPFGTGLFDFNQAGHVTPAWIVNGSCGVTLHLQGVELAPSLYITNLFDHEHLLKGAYTNGPSWEEPRNIIFKLAVHV